MHVCRFVYSQICIFVHLSICLAFYLFCCEKNRKNLKIQSKHIVNFGNSATRDSDLVELSSELLHSQNSDAKNPFAFFFLRRSKTENRQTVAFSRAKCVMSRLAIWLPDVSCADPSKTICEVPIFHFFISSL